MPKQTQRELKAPVPSSCPRVEARGFRVCSDDPDACPGITNEELDRVLSPEERSRFHDWTGGGITIGPNGVYVFDVEDFLSGLPNMD